MKIRCRTSFDITATGITGHYKPSRVPFTDQAGNRIVNEATWIRARNQQRNWETLTQLISLRTQVNNLSLPQQQDNTWCFEFEIDNMDLFRDDNSELGVLINDCVNVPIINQKDTVELLVIQPGKNLWFDIIDK